MVISMCDTTEATTCTSHEYLISPKGHFCPNTEPVLYHTEVEKCKLACIHSATCLAINHNTTDDMCTFLADPCNVAVDDPVMQYVVYRPIPIHRCYEWVPYTGVDPTASRLVSLEGKRCVSRVKEGGSDHCAFMIPELNRCFACLGTKFLDNSVTQHPCQLLRIVDGCTALWVPHTAGDPIPNGAVSGGYVVGKGDVFIASFVYNYLGTFHELAAYYIRGAPHAISPAFRGCRLNQRMNVLIVLWDNYNGI